MEKLATFRTPNFIGVYVAKAKFKLDNVRYRKFRTAKWSDFLVW